MNARFVRKLTAFAVIGALAGACGSSDKPQAPTVRADNTVAVNFHPASDHDGGFANVTLTVNEAGTATEVASTDLTGGAADAPFTGDVALNNGSYDFVVEARANDNTLLGIGQALNVEVENDLTIDLYMVTTNQPDKWGAGKAGPGVLALWANTNTPLLNASTEVHAQVLYQLDGELTGDWVSQCGSEEQAADPNFDEASSTHSDFSLLDSEYGIFSISNNWAHNMPEQCTLFLTVASSDTVINHTLSTIVDVSGSMVTANARFIDHPLVSEIHVYAGYLDEEDVANETPVCIISRLANTNSCSQVLAYEGQYTAILQLALNVQDFSAILDDDNTSFQVRWGVPADPGDTTGPGRNNDYWCLTAPSIKGSYGSVANDDTRPIVPQMFTWAGLVSLEFAAYFTIPDNRSNMDLQDSEPANHTGTGGSDGPFVGCAVEAAVELVADPDTPLAESLGFGGAANAIRDSFEFTFTMVGEFN